MSNLMDNEFIENSINPEIQELIENYLKEINNEIKRVVLSRSAKSIANDYMKKRTTEIGNLILGIDTTWSRPELKKESLLRDLFNQRITREISDLLDKIEITLSENDVSNIKNLYDKCFRDAIMNKIYSKARDDAEEYFEKVLKKAKPTS